MPRQLPWLQATLARRLSAPVDLRKVASEDVPQSPGVYIMQSDDTEYPYPWRGSLVFYIGSASNLRQRIWTKHRNFCREIWENRPDPDYDHYYPVYEYAGYHGCRVSWIVCTDIQEAKALENNLIIDFAKHHGVWPVANKRGAWAAKP